MLQYFDQIQDVMRRSGKWLMHKFESRDYQIFEKDTNTSLVTSVDLENERFLIQELQKIVPGTAILAEELGYQGEESNLTWVIDPLDGTRNFVKGIPLFCIMVSL